MPTLNKAGGRLADKVALVFGAGCVGPGWGNGRAIAVRFAQEGAIVIAVDKRSESLPETLALAGDCRERIETHICDVGDAGQVADLVARVLRRHGRIDVLVNNVGGPVPGGPTALSIEDWQRQLDLNLTSVFTTCRQVLPIMQAQAAAPWSMCLRPRPSAGRGRLRWATRRPRRA